MKLKKLYGIAGIAISVLASFGISEIKAAETDNINITGTDIEVWIGDEVVCPHDISISTNNDSVYDETYGRIMYEIYDNSKEGYKVYAMDDEGENGGSDGIVDTVLIRPVKDEITLPGIRAYGSGDVVLYSAQDLDTELTEEERKTDVTLEAYKSGDYSGYAFYGDVENAFYGATPEDNEKLVSPDNKIHFSIEDGARIEDKGAMDTINGIIKTTSFSARNLRNLNVGDMENPVENMFEFSCGQTFTEEENDLDYMVEFNATAVNAYVKGMVLKSNSIEKNYKLIRVMEEASLSVNDAEGSSQMFDCNENTLDAPILRVQTGGEIKLNSTAEIKMPKVQSGYYTKKETIETISNDGKIQDKLNIVDCSVGDKTDVEGRYVYTVADTKNEVKIISTGKSLYPFETGRIEKGSFKIDVATGITNGSTYWLEKDTPVTFSLLPDPGCQYKKGTLYFLGKYEDNDEYIKKAETPGQYIYNMDSLPVNVSCEFEEKKDSSKVTSTVVKATSINRNKNILNGGLEFTVNELDKVSTSTKNKILEAAGDLDIGAYFDLSLNSVIETVNNEEAWITPINNLKNNTTVTFAFKDTMKENTNYAIIRVYDGKAEKIGVTHNAETNKMSFRTKVFATYALVYEKVDLSKCEISLSTSNYTYNGKEKKPKVTVKYGTEVIGASHYTVTYSDNVNAGTATVKVSANSTTKHVIGSIKTTYVIAKAANKMTLTTGYKKIASTKAQTILLDPQATEGSFTYTSSNSKVKVSTAGKVTIPAGFVGKAVITVKVTDKNYTTLSKKVTVMVVPTKVSLKTLANNTASKLTVTWKKNSYATAYEIQYSTTKTFVKSKTKTITVKDPNKITATIKNLKKSKKYYVRIRAYKTVSKVKYYSSWSTVKAKIITK